MNGEDIGRALERLPPESEKSRQERVRERFWSALRRVAGNLPFLEDLAAAYFCVMDGRTPARVRGTLLAALAYFIMPADLVPDILAGFGFTDDIAVLTAAFAAVSGHITKAHREAAKKAVSTFLAEKPGA